MIQRAVLLLGVLLAWRASASLDFRLDRIALRSGEEIVGSFEPQRLGVFQWTEHGGKLYRWEVIDPTSLPATLRDAVRQDTERQLMLADQLYRQQRIPEASSRFRYVLRHQHFLSEEARESPAFAFINEKAHGEVFYEDSWMPFEARQELLGLAFYNGEWLPRQEAQEVAAFEQGLRAAARSRDLEAARLDLRLLLRRYPDSEYAPLGRESIQRLTEAIARRDAEEAAQRELERQRERQAQREAVQQPAAPAVEEHVFYNDPYSYGYSVGWDTGFGPVWGSTLGRNHGRGRGHRPEQTTVRLNEGTSAAVFTSRGSQRYDYNTTYPFSGPVRAPLTIYRSRPRADTRPTDAYTTQRSRGRGRTAGRGVTTGGRGRGRIDF